MESFLTRYRNISVLLLVILAQLILLAMQVKNDQDVRVIRVWAVTAVTPAARIVEAFRGGGVGFLHNYILLHNADAENRRLKEELGRYKMENVYLKNQLATADRAQALAMFQQHTPSKTLAATVIASGAGSNSKVVFVDRGSLSGVMRGMAVVTPDGIVGKVIAAYPTASEVLLITDTDFAAGVVTQKSGIRGTLKGQGKPICIVDYIPPEDKIAVGDWFYTSGDDRVFPRGFAVGVVKSVRAAQPFQEIYVEPSGLQHGLEDVLILLESVHQDIPDTPPVNQPVYIAPPPPGAATAEGAPPADATPNAVGTEADKLRATYKAVGDAQNHVFGAGAPGTKPPNFNLPLPSGGLVPAQTPAAGAPKPAAAPATAPQQAPAVAAPKTTPQQAPVPAPPKAPAPQEAAPKTDATRRANQTAGGPPGGPPHE